MNINNGIIKSAGISLGNLELATEYLYGDSSLYEPELSGIKSAESDEEPVVKGITRKDTRVINEKIISKFEIEIEQAVEQMTGKVDDRYSTDIWGTVGDTQEIVETERKDGEKHKEEIEHKQDENTEERTLQELYDSIKEKKIAEQNKVLSNTRKEATVENKSKTKKRLEETTHSTVDDLDSIINNANRAVKKKTVAKKENTDSKKIDYNEMELSTLADYVKKFLIAHGVRKGAVDVGIVTAEFGEENIRRLIKKCYIIKVGKGVTIGI